MQSWFVIFLLQNKSRATEVKNAQKQVNAWIEEGKPKVQQNTEHSGFTAAVNRSAIAALANVRAHLNFSRWVMGRQR